MKTSIQQWLTERASPPGMLACGVRRPDGKLICRSIEDVCPSETMERILGQFESIRASLFTDQFSPRWCNWAFDQGQIRFVERPDGWLLGLVIRNESDALPCLDPLSFEFIALDLGR